MLVTFVSGAVGGVKVFSIKCSSFYKTKIGYITIKSIIG